MKHFIPSISLLALASLSGCAGTNQNSLAGSRIPDPYIDPQANAHLDLNKRVSGNGSVETYQILFVKFNAGGQETNVGNVGNRLRLKDNFPINPFELLFRSPADRQAAVDAAYYNAVENGNCDALINTKVQLHTEGFSILGLYGHGTANATVDAYGLNINKGILPHSAVNQKANTKSLLQSLFGDNESGETTKPTQKVAKKKAVAPVETASSVASTQQTIVKDNSGTSYLASVVEVPQHPFGKMPSNGNGF